MVANNKPNRREKSDPVPSETGRRGAPSRPRVAETGSSPAASDWGAMLARAYQYMDIAPEQMYAPGLAILVVSLAFNALGESLRIVLDPTMKDR